MLFHVNIQGPYDAQCLREGAKCMTYCTTNVERKLHL